MLRPGESKAKKLLNWYPKISLEEGVNILLDNIDYWKNSPRWDDKSIEKATHKWFKYLGNQEGDKN